MTTAIDYALMAGTAYISNRPEINQIPIPQGWIEFFHVPNNPAYPMFTGASGFEAVSFQNVSNPNEIVISFAGTDFSDGLESLLEYDFWNGNIPLITGTSINGADQLVDAVEYYLQVKALNPDTNISLTGHSLGGALAALVGVFFGKTAFTFDQVPARATAMAQGAAVLYTELVARHHTADELAPLYNYMQQQQANGGIPNEGLVTNLNVAGEVAGNIPLAQRIGNEASIDSNHPGLENPATDLHSIALLNVFLQSNQTAPSFKTLSDVTIRLPDLLKMIFDPGLFYNDPLNKKNPKENFLERLVKHEAGVRDPATGATTQAADQMVKRFTEDLWKIAQNGGFTLTNQHITSTLVAFGMQFYYESAKATDSAKHLFSDVSGGIRFNREDVAAKLFNAKGWNLYFQNYQAEGLTLEEHKAVLQLLPAAIDWFVQAGNVSMSATANDKKAFMLGGTGADYLVGGTESDLLIGNEGNDTLKGSKGNDTLIGGAGNDTYVINTGEGIDTVLDSDGSGIVLIDGIDAKGSATASLDPTKWKQLSANAWVDQKNNITYTKSVVNGVTQLLIHKGDSNVLVKGWNDGNLGIALGAGTPAPPPVIPSSGGPIVGDLLPFDKDTSTPGIQLKWDDLGNVVMTGAAKVGRQDIMYDGGGNDTLQGLGGNDLLMAIHGGDNVLEGGDGNDALLGGAGNDWLFATSQTSDLNGAIAQGDIGTGTGQKGDLLGGGSGDDILVGDNGNDTLLGGAGKDEIIGGAGDDNIIGDADLGFYASASYATTESEAESQPFLWDILRQTSALPDGVTHDLLNWQASYGSAGGTDPADLKTSPESADQIYAGSGEDWVIAQNGDDFVDAGSGNDTVWGGTGDDVILGKEGDDYLEGDDIIGTNASLHGNDYIDGGSGNDSLFGDGGDDVLLGGEGDDHIQGDGPDNFIAAQYQGNDYLDGGDGNDNLLGNGGDDISLGGAGNDNLGGGDGNDILDGGAGADYLEGGAGDDTYLNVTGEDTIFDAEGDNTIILATANSLGAGGVSTSEFTKSDGSAGMQLNVALDTGDTLNFQSAFFGTNATLQFANGDTLDLETLASQNITTNLTLNLGNTGGKLYGAAGNDTLTGGTGNDILIGHKGTDTLFGGAGDDTYLWNLGDGYEDIIIESGGSNDVLKLGEGILPGNVSVSRNALTGDDLLLAISDENGAPAGSIRIKNYLVSQDDSSRVDRIEFADGTVWTYADIKTLLTKSATSRDDYLIGFGNVDVLDGLAGNDVCWQRAA